MSGQVRHVEGQADPPRRRDVDDVGVLAHVGKDPERARAMSMKLRSRAWRVSLRSQPNHHLVTHFETPMTMMRVGSLFVRCILLSNPIINVMMQLTHMLCKCDTILKGSNVGIYWH